jgi:serine/threonine-protein kinase
MMKVCPVCGEVYRAHAARCPAHDVPLRPWSETTSDTRLATATDVDRLRTPDHDEPTVADTPLVQVSADLASPRAPAGGRVLGGRYRLSRQLGVGGYGAVFAADDLTSRERVAVKVLTPAAASSPEMITRFHREAIAASRSRHPHIVDVADFDVDDDGNHFIVMEHLDGHDLADVLERSRRLAPARALVIAAQCARGLAAAHRVGVLHRDLKPANVFLVQRPGGGESVKIIDFGISKLTRAAGDYTDVTSASKVVGTPAYMAPEQARGAELDARTDVYALGVMLFEMLVGARPFTGRSPIEILTKHVEAPRVPPSALRPELAGCPGLDALVVRAMAPVPAARFRSMEELGEAIVACLRAIDPAAAEHATEITGELAEPGEIAGTRRRPAGVAAVVLAVVAVIALAALAGRGGGGPGGEPERPAARPPEPAPGPPVSAPAPAAPVLVPVPVALPAAVDPSPPAVDAGTAAPARTPKRDRRRPRRAPTSAATLGVEEW